MSCCANTGRSVPKVITGVQRRLTPAQCLEALNIHVSYDNVSVLLALQITEIFFIYLYYDQLSKLHNT